MKTLYLPYFLSKIVKIMSYIVVFFLDIIHFVLTPITWIQLKAHFAMIVATGLVYIYLNHIMHVDNAAWTVVVPLLAVVLAVALVKLIRKTLHRIRQRLINIVYSPVGVCFRIRPLYLFKTNVHNTNLAPLEV